MIQIKPLEWGRLRNKVQCCFANHAKVGELFQKENGIFIGYLMGSRVFIQAGQELAQKRMQHVWTEFVWACTDKITVKKTKSFHLSHLINT